MNRQLGSAGRRVLGGSHWLLFPDVVKRLSDDIDMSTTDLGKRRSGRSNPDVMDAGTADARKSKGQRDI